MTPRETQLAEIHTQFKAEADANGGVTDGEKHEYTLWERAKDRLRLLEEREKRWGGGE